MEFDFKLEASEHKRVYKDEIEPAFFLDTTSVNNPRVVFVGGQPGAGKSYLFSRSMGEFDDENVVPINTDELKAFHPQYVEIVQADDKVAAEHTHRDASAWNRRLLLRCIETKRNMVVEGVFKDGEGLAAIIRQLREAGYEIMFRLVAVHERHSILGICSRYEQEKIVRGHGRFVPFSYHNDCYDRIIGTINLLESQKLIEHFEIYNRSCELLYSNSIVDEKWHTEPVGAHALVEGREQKLSSKQKSVYREMWRSVIERMKNRGAPVEELEAIQKVSSRLCAALEAEADTPE